MKCPSLQQIEDYLHGELDPTEIQSLQEHFSFCDSCQSALEKERMLDDLLRDQKVIKAPEGFLQGVMVNIRPRSSLSRFPDWIGGIALGVFITFIGFLLGKYAVPFLGSLSENINNQSLRIDLLDGLNKVDLFSKSHWNMVIPSVDPLFLINLSVSLVILCWGLWQMVKAVRR